MNDLGYAGDKTPEESWAMLSEISGAVLVDVRTDAEWAFVGTPDLGSLGKNLCLAAWIVYPNMTGNADFVATVQNHAPDTDAHILFICRSGQRSIAAAIALNGVAAEENLTAFAWGRVAAADPDRIDRLTGTASNDLSDTEPSLDDFIAGNGNELLAYQNQAYRARYLERMQKLRDRIDAAAPGRDELGRAAARNLYRLMAYKDEYEVARLFTDGRFQAQLSTHFSGDIRLGYHLAPPLFAPTDPVSGVPRKIRFGPWMLPIFKMLAEFKFLRGSAFDPFGALAERRAERNLRDQFEAMIDAITGSLTAANYDAGLALVSNYDQVRGFGHIKGAAMEAAAKDLAGLRAAFDEAPTLWAAE